MNAVLHVISDRQRHRLPLLDALIAAADGGADVIQIREKKAPAADTWALVEQLQTSFHERNLPTQVYVNDRLDVALAADLHGVHLAAKSLPIAAVRRIQQQASWIGRIGCSVHTLEEAQAAERAGADYVTFGHIFASESHPGLPPRGLHALRRVVEALSIPVIAIGGIDITNIDPVLATGVSGIAVIGAVLDAADPAEAARGLTRAMARSTVKPKVPFPQRPGTGVTP